MNASYVELNLDEVIVKVNYYVVNISHKYNLEKLKAERTGKYDVDFAELENNYKNALDFQNKLKYIRKNFQSYGQHKKIMISFDDLKYLN